MKLPAACCGELHLPNLFRFQSRIPLLPPVERLLSNPEVADEVGNGGPHLRLLEYLHNLLDTESFFCFTASSFPFSRPIMQETLPHVGTTTGGRSGVAEGQIAR